MRYRHTLLLLSYVLSLSALAAGSSTLAKAEAPSVGSTLAGSVELYVSGSIGSNYADLVSQTSNEKVYRLKSGIAGPVPIGTYYDVDILSPALAYNGTQTYVNGSLVWNQRCFRPNGPFTCPDEFGYPQATVPRLGVGVHTLSARSWVANVLGQEYVGANDSFTLEILPAPSNNLTVSLSGTSWLENYGTGSWTATAQNGTGSSYTFRWYHRPPGSSTYTLKTTRTKTSPSDSYSQYLNAYGQHSVKVEVTRGSQTAAKTRLVQVNEPDPPCGGGIPCRPVHGGTAGVGSQSAAPPADFVLYAPAPNPVRDRLTVRYDLPEASGVRLGVYDVLGREVVRVTQGQMEAGQHRVSVEMADLPAGVYVVRLQTGTRIETQRVTLLK